MIFRTTAGARQQGKFAFLTIVKFWTWWDICNKRPKKLWKS